MVQSQEDYKRIQNGWAKNSKNHQATTNEFS